MKDSTGWLLNVCGVGEVQQAEMHTAETQVPLCSACGVDTATENVERHKSPGVNQIPSELFIRGGVTVYCGYRNINVLFGKTKKCFGSGRNCSLYLCIRLTVVTCINYIQCVIQHNAVKVNCMCR